METDLLMLLFLTLVVKQQDLSYQSTALAKPNSRLQVSYQIDMFKDFRGAVHLSQDDDHLIVYELLKLPQVTHHLHLQLCSDLRNGDSNSGKNHDCWWYFSLVRSKVAQSWIPGFLPRESVKSIFQSLCSKCAVKINPSKHNLNCVKSCCNTFLRKFTVDCWDSPVIKYQIRLVSLTTPLLEWDSTSNNGIFLLLQL